MWCEPLTCKHSNMRNTFIIQMKKNCFLAIKAPCSPASQPDNAVKSECKSCSDSLIIYLFVCLLMYFPIMLFFSCCFIIQVEYPCLVERCSAPWELLGRSLRLQHNRVYNKTLDLCNHFHSMINYMITIYIWSLYISSWYIYSVIWSLYNDTEKWKGFIKY